jgi:hypothetical protein
VTSGFFSISYWITDFKEVFKVNNREKREKRDDFQLHYLG